MSFALIRPLAYTCHPYFLRAACNRTQKFLVPRKAFPPAHIQSRHYVDFAGFVRKVIIAVTGVQPLNAEETQEVIKCQQILWVAHWSIDNHEAADEHYELAYSMQLFHEPKNFDTQQYYISLIEKAKSELTLKEIKEIIDMYQLAISQTTLSIRDLCYTPSLKKKLEEYQILLSEKEKG